MLNREFGRCHILVVDHRYFSSLGVFDVTGFIIIRYFFQEFYTGAHMFIDEGAESGDDHMIVRFQLGIFNIHDIFHCVLDDGVIGGCGEKSIEDGVDGLDGADGYEMFCADDFT